jgi:hypothetical protein
MLGSGIRCKATHQCGCPTLEGRHPGSPCTPSAPLDDTPGPPLPDTSHVTNTQVKPRPNDSEETRAVCSGRATCDGCHTSLCWQVTLSANVELSQTSILPSMEAVTAVCNTGEKATASTDSVCSTQQWHIQRESGCSMISDIIDHMHIAGKKHGARSTNRL